MLQNNLISNEPSLFRSLAKLNHKNENSSEIILQEGIERVIQMYEKETHGFVNQFLRGNFFYGKQAQHLHPSSIGKTPMITLKQSIQDIIEYALQDDKKEIIHRATIDKNNVYCFGDIHAQLDLFVQNLYIAGLIDSHGNLIANPNKRIIQVGDTINKGPYHIETVVYLRHLEEQAKERGLEWITLLGNHELKVVNRLLQQPNEQMDKNAYHTILAKMLQADMLSNRIVLTHAKETDKLFACHGGLPKETLIKSILMMTKHPQYKQKLEKNKKRFTEIYKLLLKKHQGLSDEMNQSSLQKLNQITSSEYIYSLMEDANIQLSDISKWMNKTFHNAVLSASKEHRPLQVSQRESFLYFGKDSILESRNKAKNLRHPDRGADDSRSFLILPTEEKYNIKPIIVSGHSVTLKKVKGYGEPGGILQNKANLFIDVGLSEEIGGRQAFLVGDSKTGKLNAVEIPRDQLEEAKYLKETNRKTILEKIKKVKIREVENVNFLTKKRQQTNRSLFDR